MLATKNRGTQESYGVCSEAAGRYVATMPDDAAKNTVSIVNRLVPISLWRHMCCRKRMCTTVNIAQCQLPVGAKVEG